MIECYTDGSCEPINPGGKIGIGVVIDNGKFIHEHSEMFAAHPENTNNIAEYKALKYLLDYLKLNEIKDDSVVVKSDSKILVNQMNNKWKIKNRAYSTVAKECKVLAFQLTRDNRLSFEFVWIPREENQHADYLSKLDDEIVC